MNLQQASRLRLVFFKAKLIWFKVKNITVKNLNITPNKKLTGLGLHMVRLALVFFLLSFRGGLPHLSAGFEKQNLLYWAELLVNHIDAHNTDYRHKEISVKWAEFNGTDHYESLADCSGFINALFKQTYSWDEKYFKSWLGKMRPLAYNYYDAINEEHGFTSIQNIKNILPGDLIAIKYKDRSEHDDNTGHLLLVAERPAHRMATALVEQGMEQYEVSVIDASKSPHGKSDSRHNPDGTSYPGLGKGLFRLYADEKGIIKGYSWSTEKPKIGFDPFANPIIIGRTTE